jgi:5-methylcytosine-specific restriction endonuclease McrA
VICETAVSKAYRKANPNKVIAHNAAHRAANREKGKATAVAWRAANREKSRADSAAYRVANPVKRRAFQANRRARKRQAGGMYSAADIAALLRLQRGKCAHSWCGKSVAKGYHVDHILPLFLGGSNDRRNLQILCRPCNQEKHAAHPIDFAQLHGLLL